MAIDLINKFSVLTILVLSQSISTDCLPIKVTVTESPSTTAIYQNGTKISYPSSELNHSINSSSSSIEREILVSGSSRPELHEDNTSTEPSIETVTKLIEYDETSYSGSSASSKASSSTQAPIDDTGRLDFSVTRVDSAINSSSISHIESIPNSSPNSTTPIVINLDDDSLDLGSTPSSLDGVTVNSAPTEDIISYNSSESSSMIEVRQVSSTSSTNFVDQNGSDANPNTDSTKKRDEEVNDDTSYDQDEDVMMARMEKAKRDRERIEEQRIIENLLVKKPFGKFLSVEQKWDDLFRRFFEAKRVMMRKFTRLFFKDLEQYVDISVSPKCSADLKYIQDYTKTSSNTRWVMRMFDSFGKSEPGIISGNVPNLGHVLQCVRVRAPDKASNDSFDERDFVKQTEALGERFRGKYCLVSVSPVMPPRPKLISRYKSVLDLSLLSNLTYMGHTRAELDLRKLQSEAPPANGYDEYSLISNLSADYVPPFQSPLYQYMIEQNSILYTYTRQMGVCYPSSCSREDIRESLQKTFNDYHQVVSLDYECEQEPYSITDWLNTSRAVAFFILTTMATVSALATFLKIYVFVPRTNRNSTTHDATTTTNKQQPVASADDSIRDMLNILAIDKCSGYLFIKTKAATTVSNEDKLENNHRSTTIDALKGFLILMFIYSQLVTLGCLPVPFLWSKWTDAMVPFFRAPFTQIFLNAPIWMESFYFISGYVLSYRLLDKCVSRHLRRAYRNTEQQMNNNNLSGNGYLMPSFGSYVCKKYIRLVPPMLGLICINYVWPHLSNGFVMNDLANKIQEPCDKYGWTNMLLFHNNDRLNETCLWPTHVSAVQFQLHLIAYPIIYLMAAGLTSLMAYRLRQQFNQQSSNHFRSSPDSNSDSSGKYQDKFDGHLEQSTTSGSGFIIDSYKVKTKHLTTIILAVALCLILIVIGMIYPAMIAANEQLIVPFVIDYPDYNNYQRVIELMYMPTYNHLIGYSMGLLLALFVVFRRYFSSDIATNNNKQMLFRNSKHNVGKKIWIWSSDNRDDQQQQLDCIVDQDQADTKRGKRLQLVGLLASLVSFVAIASVLMSTFHWAGLGNEITETHTFMFVLLAKLMYLLPFTWLFYRYVATRKNSTNPWILTRFLVPLGRMSGSIYFSSWIIVWFDLLSSPYQWHPSHYFMVEKYLELAFMTLILAIFMYAIFEGPIVASGHISRFVSYRRRKLYNENINMVNNNANGNNDITIGDDKEKVQQANMLRIVGSDVVVVDQQQQSSGMKRLSIVDQKKLNAELRANTSFASLSNLSDGGMIVMSMGADNKTHSTASASTTTLISNNNSPSDYSQSHRVSTLVRLSPSGQPTAPIED